MEAEAAIGRGWWETRMCVSLVVLAAAIPLVYPAIPPLVDLLGHMGRFEVALELWRSPTLHNFYTFHWAPIGNLGVDLLVRLLAPIVGLEPATKIVVALIPPLTAAGFLWAAREMNGRIAPAAYLAIPFAYGQPFLYGFVNFSLSMALAFIAFALWLRLGRLGRSRLRAAIFVPLSLLVFFAHVYGWGVLGLICFSAEVARERDRGSAWPSAVFRAGVEALCLASPLIIMAIWRSSGSGPLAWAFFEWGAKLLWIETALRDRWQWFDLISVGAIIVVIFVAARQSRIATVAVFPAIALGILFLLFPETMLGSTFADMRLVPYVIALLLIGIRPAEARTSSSLAAALALAFVTVRLTANTLSLADSWREQQARIGAVAHVPIGARVAAFVGIECHGSWALTRDIHLPSLITVRRQGFSNDQWIIEGAFGLGVKVHDAGYFAADPSQIVLPNGCNDGAHRTVGEALSKFPRHAFDYLWLIDTPALDPALSRGLEPVWENPGSALYRIDERANARIALVKTL